MVHVEPLFGPVYVMADVIANVADVTATILQIGLSWGSWCYCYFFVADVITTFVYCVLADVIAMVVDVKTTQGRWYMADVIAICGWCYYHIVSIYFRISSEMLTRTSSHICGRWYLPAFLFRDGLLALIYRASFMVLMRLWSSLPSIVKLSTVTSWPEVFWWSYMGDGALRCSFNLSSKFLADSPIYSSSQSTLSHLYL